MDFVAMLAEEKIKEAIRDGELDNLPGKGKKLRLDDLSAVPEELRAGFIILKNAGILPEELQLKKEIITLQKLIDCCSDEPETVAKKKELNEKILRFNILMEKRHRTGSAALKQYRDKIYSRLR